MKETAIVSEFAASLGVEDAFRTSYRHVEITGVRRNANVHERIAMDGWLEYRDS